MVAYETETVDVGRALHEGMTPAARPHAVLQSSSPMTPLPDLPRARHAMNFIDLERRFHVLTGTELEDLEALVSRSEHRSGLDIGWPDLLDDSRVVLLAEAGSGKTVEMRKQVERLVGEGKYAFFLALDFLDRDPVSDCLSPDETRRFEAWKKDREAPAWFFLDAVDELKLTQGKLDRALRRLSKDLDGHLHHTRIIISCRPSDWRPGLDLDTMHSRLPVPEIGGAAPSVPPMKCSLAHSSGASILKGTSPPKVKMTFRFERPCKR